MRVPPASITDTLIAARSGDASASERLWFSLYDELHRIAHRELARMRPGQTLTTTALVHEAYLKLAGPTGIPPEHRTHFLAVSCKAMRQVLIDEARARLAQKRGSGRALVSMEESMVADNERSDELLAIDEALNRLSAIHPRMASVVECRYFGGFTIVETAATLGISPRTADMDWKMAKAYLYDALKAERSS